MRCIFSRPNLIRKFKYKDKCKYTHKKCISLNCFKNEKGAICSVHIDVWWLRACFCVYMNMFVYVCVCLAHLLPVWDASDRGHDPEPKTATSSQSSAGGREAPAGGRGWEKYPSKLERWYSHAKPLNTLSPLIMFQLSAVQMGGYAISISHSKSEKVWISTPPIRWFVSKCSLKVFDFCSHFSLSYRKARRKGCVWKSTQISSVSCLLFITKVLVVLVCSSLGEKKPKHGASSLSEKV